MTVPTSDNREQYLGNDSTTVFGYVFKIFRDEDLEVYLVEGDAQTLQTLGTDYSVSGAGNESGGNVTMTTAPTSSQTLVILRIVAVVQETDLRNQGAYYPETVEDEFDRSRMIDQQQQDEINRTLRRPEALDYWDAENRNIRNVKDAVELDDAVNKGQMDARFSDDVITKTGSHWDGKGLQARNFSVRSPVQDSDLPNMAAIKAYFTKLESGAVGDTTKVTAEGTADQRALAAWMKALGYPTTSTGTDQPLAEALDDRSITVNTVAELKASPLQAGNGVLLTESGRAGSFIVKSGTPPVDPQEGIYIVLANGNYAERVKKHPVEATWFGVVADGATDDTGSFVASKDYTESVEGTLILPPRTLRLTSGINLDQPINIIGTYPNPYLGAIGGRGEGSWLYFDHGGIGLDIARGTVQGTVFLDKFGTVRNQPTPAAGWAPNPHDYDIVFNDTDLIIGDIILYNPTKGIRGINGNYGRLRINSLRGQPLQIGLFLDEQYDAPSINHIHFWPFWQDNMDVHNYTMQNLDALYFQRVDNPNIDTLFTIFARATLRLGQSSNGVTNKFRIGNVDSDRGKFGIFVDSGASGATGQIANWTSQGETGLAGTKALFIEGSNCNIDFANFRADVCDQNAIRLAGGDGNRIRIGNATISQFNLSQSGFHAVEVTLSNTVRFAQLPSITGDGGSGGKYSSSGRIFVNEWRQYTPAVTASSGTITELGVVNGRYKKVDDSVYFEIDITIVTNGTAAGSIEATLPEVSQDTYIGSGREVLLSGDALTATVGGGQSKAVINKYNNSYPGADGVRIIVNGFYRIAQ